MAVGARWDFDALKAGGSIALVFAIPITIIASIVDSPSSGLNALFFFAAILGFIVGAGCAAWIQQVGTPWSHGIVTAAGTYLAAQSVFIVVRLVAGSSISWFRIFFTLSLVVGAGLIGGILGSRLQRSGAVPSSHRAQR